MAENDDVEDIEDIEDIKEKMRAALDRKRGASHPDDTDGRAHEKAHGSEVQGGAPKMHRRKAGGGGA